MVSVGAGASLVCSRLRDSGESAKRKRGRKHVGAGERQALFPRSRAFYFHVPFLIFVPSLLSESLEQARASLDESFG